MASERYIDLQLIKPLTKGSGAKGKISLTSLLKEYFNKLNVGFVDSCCPVDSVGAFNCPAISEDEGNIIECRNGALYATAEGEGFLTTANNGLSLDGTTVQLGGPLIKATVITGDSNIETLSLLGATTGDFVTINNSDLTGRALHVEGDVRLLGPKVYIGNRTIEGTNENYFITATSRVYSEHSVSSNPTLVTNFSAAKVLYLNDGANLNNRLQNIFSQNSINLRGAATIQGITNEISSHRFDTIIARSFDFTNTPSLTGPVTPLFPLTSLSARLGISSTGAVSATGWYSGLFTSLILLSAAHTMDNYADIVVGGATYNSGSTITNRYGLYINPISSPAVANSYGIFQVGTSDINYFGGNTCHGNTYVIPTAYIHFGAGTAAAGTAPVKFTSGTNNTTAETGAVEYNGTNLFFTRVGTTRETIFTGNDAAAAPTTVAAGTVTNRYGGATNFLGDPNSWASVVIAGTNYKVPLYT